MRRRVILIAVGLIVVVGISVLVAAADGDDEGSAAPTVPGLDAQTVTAGAVDVEITPSRIDDQAAVFAIALDTHSVELSADLATSARLEVDGVAWPVEAWSGDGPGGHHRSGELHFRAAGPATGDVRLAIDGLPEPVEATWTLRS